MRHACWVLVVCFLAGCGSSKRDELLPLDKAPAELLEAVRQSQPDVTFDQVLKQTNGNFEFRGSSNSGRIKKVTVSPEGKILRTK